MKIGHLPIQRRLSVIIFLTTLSVLLGSYFGLFLYETKRSEDTTVENLKTMANIIASDSAAALIYEDSKVAQENMSGLRADPDIDAAALFDRQGHLYAAYPARVARASLPTAPGPDGPRFSLRTLTLYQPVMEGPDRVGTLYLKSNLGGMYRRLRVYGCVLAAALVGGILFAFYVSSLLQRQIARPILHLAETARAISEKKDYSVRAPNRDGDELGFVTEAFNSMLDQIQASHAALRESERQTRSASRAKDDFLAALSHELRTPLNPILLLATDAANNPELPVGVRGDFDTVRKNVELEARLIDDLLDVTSIASGKVMLRREAVDAHAVIRDAVATIQGDLAIKRIELTLNFAAEDPFVNGDPVRLQQVFWNVLKNAVKFTPAEGRIAIATTVDAERRMLTVKVADTGIGISSDEMGHVFEAFSQGEHAKGPGSHRFGGLGLGLAISKKMIELHAGRIQAESPGRDQGSTFKIELPLADPPGAAAPGAAGNGGQSAAAGAAPGRRTLLLVEDHAPTRRVLEQLLHRRQYRVLAASTVAEGRAIAERETIDFVISDIGLPDGSGYDLMAGLEQRFGLKGIALTGYGMESDVARSRETGFVVHLTKPVTVQALDAAIAATLRQIA